MLPQGGSGDNDDDDVANDDANDDDCFLYFSVRRTRSRGCATLCCVLPGDAASRSPQGSALGELNCPLDDAVEQKRPIAA